jgi:hypothetical protein
MTQHDGDGARSARGASGLRDIVFDQSQSHPQAGALEWGAVAAIVLGVALGAVTLVTSVLWLAIPAGLLVLAGIVTGFVTDIMNRTEDY